MLKDKKYAWYMAFKAKDVRFDGRFFVGVSSTKVYCRPVCRAKMPKFENCTFYSTAAEAEQGFPKAIVSFRILPHIPFSVNRFDVLGIGRFFFQFIPQSADTYRQGVVLYIFGSVFPDPCQKPLPGEDFSLVKYEKIENFLLSAA